nr:alpha-aminoadipic semialdehyde synthase-like isoform X2 [Physcomitrium patens]XP_024367706.1 alpha-aminoadipic semialdehyde synthase-like isoform X2 [Physcomitrium patens]XP_024367707.1 alpha-aminoadipic semialdehyde synthase-like isoform X2 [Physcomitrium patens]XP_024367708.1 alpha-aminoadipic semialdehyde synthase-like isoform X2 [Physcomitrium patens]|eukprot:XP_024367705.1 alpha-aminoadipic semialdehyde synthase-like isoform X2 [Physcomitrella patens]
MHLLDKVLERRISLFDYELIKDSNVRSVYFGQFAGYAGMIDGLRGLGEWLLSRGYSTPFLSIGSTYMYTSLSVAKQAVLAIGEEIKTSGLPPEICPLIFVFTGAGNVSQGAQEILNLLPHEFVHPSKLSELTDTSPSKVPVRGVNFKVYGCVVASEHMVERKIPGSGCFDKHHYYEHPEEYSPVFAKNIAPHASVLVNCMYWEQRFPRLLTIKELLDLRSSGRSRLQVVVDITCDKGGSIECLKKYSSIQKPFFRYNPENDSTEDDMDGDGILFMAVDCLPTELPRESTKHFGNALFPFLVNLANAKTLAEIHVPVRDACIAHEGSLTEMYKYIQKLREANASKTPLLQEREGMSNSPISTIVSLSGHLFDQHLINEALDVICAGGGRYRLATCKLGQSDDETSCADLEVTAGSQDALNCIVDKLAEIAVKGSNIRHRELEGSRDISESNENGIALEKNYQVLILGAGRMCEPAVRHLTSTKRRFRFREASYVDNGLVDECVSVVVASLYIEDAQRVVAGVPNASAIELDTSDTQNLGDCVSKANVVISLLPADLHLPVATACIKFKKHLVTASYVSEAMQALDKMAKEADVTLLCEMGLDPGIDHLMAMKMIDSAHKRGGRVQSFVSYCGGLPSPEAANNPLGYKFSWNPAGAIKAGRNPAVYLMNGQKIEVPGEKLFAAALPVRLRDTPAFALERLPNRDSLKYGELYGISKEASTIFRATLRYQGFSKVMDALGELGYFDTDLHPLLDPGALPVPDQPTYNAMLDALLLQMFHKMNEPEKRMMLNAGDRNSLSHALAYLPCCKNNPSAVEDAAACIRWLGLDALEQVPKSCKSIFEVLCKRMEEKLTYGPEETDMVLLHHELDVELNGQVERHTATLLAFGETAEGCSQRRPESAMARTVGIPAAIAAELLLFGEVKTRGVLRPLTAEIYEPALEVLKTMKLPLVEHVEFL